MDKPVQRAGKRNAGAEAPAAADAPRPAGRGGRNAAFTGSEQGKTWPPKPSPTTPPT